MKKKTQGFIWAIAIVGAIYLAVMYLPNLGQGSVATGNDGGTTIVGASEITPDVTVLAYDIEKVGTALTETTNLYRRVGDNTWTSFTQGATIADLDLGTTYEFIMGISTSDFTDNAYGSYFSYTSKERPTDTIELALAQDEVETSLTATFYNNDGDAGAETFTAGDVQSVSIRFDAGTDEFFGNPFLSGDKTQADADVSILTATNPNGQRAQYPNVVCMDLNTSAWEKPQEVTFDGVTMNQVSQPQRHNSVADKRTYCYEAPVINDRTDQLSRYYIELEADGSTAPAQDDTLYIYAANYYINSKTGNVEWGVETDEGVAVGTDAPDSVTLDFTA